MVRNGSSVWAIDADTNPNLGLTLGVPRERLGAIQPLPRSILKERTDATGKRTMALGMTPRDVADGYGTRTPSGVTLLLMGAVDHGGAG